MATKYIVISMPAEFNTKFENMIQNINALNTGSVKIEYVFDKIPNIKTKRRKRGIHKS